MSAAMIAEEVHKAGYFDEKHLSSIIADYAGWVCAVNGSQHGLNTPKEIEAKMTAVEIEGMTWGCDICDGPICQRCAMNEKKLQCSQCNDIYCADCTRDNMASCKDCPFKRQFCKKCTRRSHTACCEEERLRVQCYDCFLDDNSPMCEGCSQPLCVTCCQRYTCRCGLHWCSGCARSRPQSSCIHNTACVCCDDKLYRHECKPRKAKKAHRERATLYREQLKRYRYG